MRNIQFPFLFYIFADCPIRHSLLTLALDCFQAFLLNLIFHKISLPVFLVSKSEFTALILSWEGTQGQVGDYEVIIGMSGSEAAERVCGMKREEATLACLPELERYMPGILK